MKLTLDNIKVATSYLCNNTSEKSAKVHRENLLYTFIQKRKTMNTMEETTRLIENEPRLEERAIRNMIREDVNK